MKLEDRVELNNDIFNVETSYSDNLKSAISIIYIKNNNIRKDLKTILEPINPKDINMKLSFIHNKTLAKLFNILKTNPKNPEEELSKETSLNKFTEENSKEEETLIPVQEENTQSHPSQLDWKEFCQNNLPKYVDFSFIVDKRTINYYAKDNQASDETSKQILTVHENLNQNKNLINSLIGSCKSTIVSTLSGYNFFYPLSDSTILIAITKNQHLGVCNAELESFHNKVMDKFYTKSKVS